MRDEPETGLRYESNMSGNLSHIGIRFFKSQRCPHTERSSKFIIFLFYIFYFSILSRIKRLVCFTSIGNEIYQVQFSSVPLQVFGRCIISGGLGRQDPPRWNKHKTKPIRMHVYDVTISGHSFESEYKPISRW